MMTKRTCWECKAQPVCRKACPMVTRAQEHRVLVHGIPWLGEKNDLPRHHPAPWLSRKRLSFGEIICRLAVGVAGAVGHHDRNH